MARKPRVMTPPERIIRARRVANQAMLWYTAELAFDTAIKESGLSGLLQPSLPEVDMLRTFFIRMREAEVEALRELS